MEAAADSTIDDFERWDVPHLKNYLAKCGISQKGKKAELVALAYSCHVMNKSVTDTYTSDIQQAFNDYQEILHLANGIIIPDPFKIKNGWIGEREGMKMWPHIYVFWILLITLGNNILILKSFFQSTNLGRLTIISRQIG